MSFVIAAPSSGQGKINTSSADFICYISYCQSYFCTLPTTFSFSLQNSSQKPSAGFRANEFPDCSTICGIRLK